MKKNIIIVVVIVLGVIVYLSVSNKPEEVSLNQTASEPNDEVQQMMENVKPTEVLSLPVDNMEKAGINYSHEGLLSDVTSNSEVRGIKTSSNTSGYAKSSYEQNGYMLLVTSENLPDPVGDDFYEGWIVRKGVNFSVISTGKLFKENNNFVNKFKSSQNLLDHDFYVLTLEPNDGNPAPADHILEGTMIKK